MKRVVVTGLGMVTPLGVSAREVLSRIEGGPAAAGPASRFDATPFACRLCAEVPDFDPTEYVGQTKTLRLMGRDAQFAVAAARLAMNDAGVEAGREYQPEDIALYGSTGMAGLPLTEVAPLLQLSAQQDGAFDMQRFGAVALKRVRPVLSFKILGNMPICFVSMFQGIQGFNGVYNPWEGQGAQAIAAGMKALEYGDARCAVVGGCDVKTHELAFIALQQHGVFQSWQEEGTGCVPGEGAVFLVLEEQGYATSRGARIYARLAGVSCRSVDNRVGRSETYEDLLRSLLAEPGCCGEDSGSIAAAPAVIVSSADGDRQLATAEEDAHARVGLNAQETVRPKAHAGNLFAAAAALQVGLAAMLAERHGSALANCFGYGREQAAFLLERV